MLGRCSSKQACGVLPHLHTTCRLPYSHGPRPSSPRSKLFQRLQPGFARQEYNISYGYVECYPRDDLYSTMELDARTDGAVYTAFEKVSAGALAWMGVGCAA